jgi:hypothetical protein
LNEQLSPVLAQKSDWALVRKPGQSEMTAGAANAQRHVVRGVDTPLVPDLD